MPCWVSPPRPSSQRSLLAGTPASRRSGGQGRRDAAGLVRSASKTTLLAELAALQLSGSGIANAPAWAGFTTWELVCGSLCCAGQRRQHAEHHGRLLLRRSGGRGPRSCAAGLLHLLTRGRAIGRLPNGHGAGRGHERRCWPTTGRSLRTCFFMPFFVCFFWTENLVFSRACSLSKQSVFRKCFLPKILGREGGGGKWRK